MDEKSKKLFTELELKANDLLNKSLVKGITKKPPVQEYTYISPDLNIKPHQLLLDSCFNIIVNSHLNLNLAKSEFETLLKRQKEDGFIAHTNYWKDEFLNRDTIYKESCKSDLIHSITQTPMIAQAQKAIFNKDRDKNFLIDYLPKVKKLYDYLYTSRIYKDDKVPLLNIIHWRESGINNSCTCEKDIKIHENKQALNAIWTNNLLEQLKGLEKCNQDENRIVKANELRYKDLLFNCVFIQGYRDIGSLYEEIGNRKESEYCNEKAKELEEVLVKNCWNPQKGLFFGLYGKENSINDVKSALSFIPLILDGLPQNIATIMVEDHLLNEKEFWLNYPVPFVALDELDYTEHGALSRSRATSIDVNWFIIQGLKKHGFENIAVELGQKTMDLIENAGFRECYSSFTGEGMGSRNFSRSTLIIDIFKTLTSSNSGLDFIFNRDWMRIKRLPDF